MIIGILSDTHDRLAAIDGAFAAFHEAGVQHVLHCGDWTRIDTVAHLHDTARRLGIPIDGVLGNNDREVEAFLSYSRGSSGINLVEGVLEIALAGRRIAVYHGHHKPTFKKLNEGKYDLTCLGHSHKPRIEQTEHGLTINPGSTAFAIPRSKTWQPSVAMYDTESQQGSLIYF